MVRCQLADHVKMEVMTGFHSKDFSSSTQLQSIGGTCTMGLVPLFTEMSATCNQLQFHLCSNLPVKVFWLRNDWSRSLYIPWHFQNSVLNENAHTCLNISTHVQTYIIIYKSQPFTCHHNHHFRKSFICVRHQEFKTLFMSEEFCMVLDIQLMTKNLGSLFRETTELMLVCIILRL
jgi:hypothetical protein